MNETLLYYKIESLEKTIKQMYYTNIFIYGMFVGGLYVLLK